MTDPNTISGWLALVEQHRQTAVWASEQKMLGNQAYFHAGLAIECSLKAYIMYSERLNSWPDKSSRPDLYTHDLRKLTAIAGVNATSSSPNAAAWHLVLNWDRNQGYDPRPMPRRVAKSWVEARWGRSCDVDPRTVGVDRKAAGADYLASIERLGLRPSAFFWAFDKTIQNLVLVLVTPIFDYAGPFALSKTLIEAYHKAGTPKEIDPFIVRMHSPEHAIIREMSKIMPLDFTVRVSALEGGGETPLEPPRITVDTGDLQYEPSWVYRFEKHKHPMKTIDAAHKWKRFVTNVHSLAA